MKREMEREKSEMDFGAGFFYKENGKRARSGRVSVSRTTTTTTTK